MTFLTYPDRELMVMDVADKLAAELETALSHQEYVTLAVPGGTTPAPIFDVLSSVHLDWKRVEVLLTDERWVPDDHERSNAGLVRQHLLQGPAAAARFTSLWDSGDMTHRINAEAQRLAECLPISVLVLGMGADMHTASLFPNAPGLADALAPDAPVLSVLEPQNQPDTRISLSAHALDGALSKHLIITGEDKRQAFEKAQHLTPQEAPIRAVMRDLTVHWAA